MVRFHTQCRQTLLHHNANRTTTPPETDDKGRSESAGIDLLTKAKPIKNLFLLGDIYFFAAVDVATFLWQARLL